MSRSGEKTPCEQRPRNLDSEQRSCSHTGDPVSIRLWWMGQSGESRAGPEAVEDAGEQVVHANADLLSDYRCYCDLGGRPAVLVG